MKCNKDYDLVGFLNNEVTDIEKSEITAHISECSDCLNELAGIRSAIRSLREVPQIEPAPDFTARVLKAVKSASPVSVPIHVSAATAESRPSGETLLDILKYYLKRSPPWAFSTALHAVILACLAFVFVGQAYKQPAQNDNIIHWTSLSLPIERTAVELRRDRASEPVKTAGLDDEALPAGNIEIDRKALVAKLRSGDDKVMSNIINRSDKTKRDELLAKYGGQGTE